MYVLLDERLLMNILRTILHLVEDAARHGAYMGTTRALEEHMSSVSPPSPPVYADVGLRL